MRILTFTSLFPNAAQPTHGIFVYHRVAHFARREGHEIQVVAPVPYSPGFLPLKRWRTFASVPHEEQIGGLAVSHPRYFFLPKISMPIHGLLMFLGSARLVRRLHREKRIDCIDAHYVYPDGFAAVLLGRWLRVPVVVSARGTDINLFPRFRSIRWMIRWTLRRADGLIAVSAALRDEMKELGADPSKIRVIANGVDPRGFEPVDRRAARSRLGLPAEARIILQVGTLIPSKGPQILIEAAARIAASHPNLRVYFVGEGESRGKLEELIRQLQLAERVTLVGRRPQEELKLWYSAADITCLASLREGMPNVLLESLACGTPVVATRVGGIPEVISSPELGVLAEPTTESFAAALESALARSWDRKTLVSRATSRTWEDVAADLEAFFSSVAQEGGASNRS